MSKAFYLKASFKLFKHVGYHYFPSYFYLFSSLYRCTPEIAFSSLFTLSIIVYMEDKIWEKGLYVNEKDASQSYLLGFKISRFDSL